MSQCVGRGTALTCSYDRLVKGATKPKAMLPKAKYMEPILESIGHKNGVLQDVLRSLSYRMQDTNSVVVLKTLLVVHTMIRSDASVAVLSYLAGDPSALRLKRVATGGLLEYTYSKTLTRYAVYLDNRIAGFKDLGYDLVQASRRDRFARLRALSLSKGLLHEIAVIQRVTKTILECASFTEDAQDELTMAALQMTLKDLLVHYMAMNEGVINMLEHYFDMSRRDAERALELYKRFCLQTEKVVAFLNSAKRLSYALRASVPALKHAPLSLAGALEEYLNDPDFDENHAEYLRNRGQRKKGSAAPGDARADKRGKRAQPAGRDDAAAPAQGEKAPPRADTAQETNQATPAREGAAAQPTSNQKALDDFFESLAAPPHVAPSQAAYSSVAGFNSQQEWFAQAPMPTGYAGYHMPPQMTGYNPFGAQTGVAPMHPQMTAGNPFGMHTPSMAGVPFGAAGPMAVQAPRGMPMQATGAVQSPGAMQTPGAMPLVPQHTMATTPFDSIFAQMSLQGGGRQAAPGQPEGASAGPGPAPQSAGSAPPSTSRAQAQPTGAPYQSNGLPPQPTGPPLPAASRASSAAPFAAQATGVAGLSAPAPSQPAGAFHARAAPQGVGAAPPASLTESPKALPADAAAAPRRGQRAMSMNPFSIPSDFEEAKPVETKPSQPTLNEIAMNAWLGTSRPPSPPSTSSPLAPQATGLMGSVASEFVGGARGTSEGGARGEPEGGETGVAPPGAAPSAAATPAAPSHVPPFSGGGMNGLHGGVPAGPLPSQKTGLAFKTESEFGKSLLADGGLSAHRPLAGQSTGLSGSGAGLPLSSAGAALFGAHSAAGSTAGLPAQATGFAGHGVFGSTPPPSLGNERPFPGNQLQPTPTGLAGIKPFTPSSAFGASLVAGGTGALPGQQATAEGRGSGAPTQDLLQL
ncbi:hypothetical protein MSPP1_003064 [Malassezia sp. CBS 17886]|nr:hypothetical protein MSPP1_003064 [Malassezia sp. CBS 17886]